MVRVAIPAGGVADLAGNPLEAATPNAAIRQHDDSGEAAVATVLASTAATAVAAGLGTSVVASVGSSAAASAAASAVAGGAAAGGAGAASTGLTAAMGGTLAVVGAFQSFALSASLAVELPPAYALATDSLQWVLLAPPVSTPDMGSVEQQTVARRRLRSTTSSSIISGTSEELLATLTTKGAERDALLMVGAASASLLAISLPLHAAALWLWQRLLRTTPPPMLALGRVQLIAMVAVLTPIVNKATVLAVRDDNSEERAIGVAVLMLAAIIIVTLIYFLVTNLVLEETRSVEFVRKMQREGKGQAPAGKGKPVLTRVASFFVRDYEGAPSDFEWRVARNRQPRFHRVFAFTYEEMVGPGIDDDEALTNGGASNEGRARSNCSSLQEGGGKAPNAPLVVAVDDAKGGRGGENGVPARVASGDAVQSVRIEGSGGPESNGTRSRIFARMRLLFPCVALLSPVAQAAIYGAFEAGASRAGLAASDARPLQMWLLLGVCAAHLSWLYVTSPFLHGLQQGLKLAGALCEALVVAVALYIAATPDLSESKREAAGYCLLALGLGGILLPLCYYLVIQVGQLRAFGSLAMSWFKITRAKAVQIAAEEAADGGAREEQSEGVGDVETPQSSTPTQLPALLWEPPAPKISPNPAPPPLPPPAKPLARGAPAKTTREPPATRAPPMREALPAPRPPLPPPSEPIVEQCAPPALSPLPPPSEPIVEPRAPAAPPPPTGRPKPKRHARPAVVEDWEAEGFTAPSFVAPPPSLAEGSMAFASSGKGFGNSIPTGR